MIDIFDSISLLASGVTLVLLLLFWKRLPRDGTRPPVVALAVSQLLYAFFLWVEWTGISAALDRYEDFIGALIPMFWAFVFYGFFQRATYAELRASEENLRVTMNSIGDGVIATDRSGSIVRMNETAQTLTGWTLDEACGRPLTQVFNIVNALSREPAANPVARVLESGELVGLANHTKLVPRDGAEYHIGDSAAPIKDDEQRIVGVVLVFRNVTGEYELRRQLAENEERMELALKGADLGTWDWDIRSGHASFDERWTEMLGYSHQSVAPHVDSWRQLIHPEDLETITASVKRHLAGRSERFEAEYRMKTRAGGWCWVLCRGRVIEHDGNGAPARACGTHLDINARKRLETQIQQFQKMEAIGRLAGGVAHDLNNLLAPVLGLSEVLLEDQGISATARQFLGEIHGAGARARDLVRQLLVFSRKHHLDLQVVNLNDIVTPFLRLLRRTIPEDIEIRTDLADGLPNIRADISQMEQIIMNLAVNAADSMPNGGGLTIQTASCELWREEQAAAEVPAGWYVVLSVSDTGCGIDDRQREFIFEPFYSTKGESGTGLGLATVFAIVRRHSGTIDVSSRADEGTIFSVYLPVSEEESADSGPEELESDELDGSETILLVEDDRAVRNMTKTMLERRGYTVIASGNSDEAENAMRSRDGMVDLLLTDVVMPGMNGRELYERLQSRCPGLKVLYMSGYPGDIISGHGITDSDALSLVKKPFSSPELASRVRQVLDLEKVTEADA